MTIYQILQSMGLPCAYSHFNKPQEPPYIAYVGDGQNDMSADNTYYWRKNQYQIEYYFKDKDESNELAIEQTLLDNGYQYQKSEDLFLEDQGVFVIYYNI